MTGPMLNPVLLELAVQRSHGDLLSRKRASLVGSAGAILVLFPRPEISINKLSQHMGRQ